MNDKNETPKIIRLVETDSTNNYLREQCAKTGLPEGSLVIADFQTAGKGQVGNSWESEAGKNLMFSLLLYPDFHAGMCHVPGTSDLRQKHRTPAISFSPDSGTCGPLCHQPAFSVCADCIFAYLHRTLRHRSLQKTKTAAAASWSCLYRGRMAGIFLCLFYLFYTFQQFFLHVWEPDSHCPPDAVALHLHLYPVYRGRAEQFPEPGACSEPVSGALT